MFACSCSIVTSDQCAMNMRESVKPLLRTHQKLHEVSHCRLFTLNDVHVFLPYHRYVCLSSVGIVLRGINFVDVSECSFPGSKFPSMLLVKTLNHLIVQVHLTVYLCCCLDNFISTFGNFTLTDVDLRKICSCQVVPEFGSDLFTPCWNARTSSAAGAGRFQWSMRSHASLIWLCRLR